ncbi:hypothetical protein M2390_003136 [Mycetocola sp. BIGb0189]|uniref:PD-(D/E)XK nuclease-like domain-containing protein n=1 Tax=Mycetocola sp. BIGb0189 TaxID=2940604 RepID=UPI0021673D7D|nr:PD-(D/E)XK nuclease-like domain-containing protein [Mycetocola sp. BIGb0189]MCS4277920.1 hypothetical protein [Mycetocola sp. BIGb0189]
MTLIPEMPEAEYHAHSALSSTGARQLLSSPAKYHYGLTHPRKDTAAFDAGTIIHTKVLGTGAGIKVLEFDNYRTKAAQIERDEAREVGLVPMLAHEIAPLEAIAESVLAHPLARVLFEKEGTPEMSLFGTDPATGADVRCRFDYYADIAVDLKTTATDASPSGFMKTAASYGYDVQEAHYRDTRGFVTGDRGEFVFVVVEKEAPYLVCVHQLDQDFREIGEAKARKAREIYARCLETGVWPGYPEEVHLIQPPVWAVYEYQEKYEK